MQQDDTKFDGQPNPFTLEGAAAIVGAAALARHGIHPYAQSVATSVPCPQCDGKGEWPMAVSPDSYESVKCEVCNGSGRGITTSF
jgi:hypothetical protein